MQQEQEKTELKECTICKEKKIDVTGRSHEYSWLPQQCNKCFNEFKNEARRLKYKFNHEWKHQHDIKEEK